MEPQSYGLPSTGGSCVLVLDGSAPRGTPIHLLSPAYWTGLPSQPPLSAPPVATFTPCLLSSFLWAVTSPDFPADPRREL